MSIREHVHFQLDILRRSPNWLPVVSLVGLGAGTLTALFLAGLDLVTQWRWDHPWTLYLLPVAGIAIAALYRAWGSSVSKGANLIIEEVHRPSAGVPFRMAPLVLVATLLTHLGGGSAGREGTAVQIGGSWAAWIGRRCGSPAGAGPLMLCCGMSAGFGAVFGTPLAGAVFGLEVLQVGRRDFRNLLPCLYAAVVGDLVCSLWGIRHTAYHIGTVLPAALLPSLGLALCAAVCGACSGLAATLFVTLMHRIKAWPARLLRQDWLRTAAGGLIVILLSLGFSLGDYLGLGVTTRDGAGVSIVNAFQPGGATAWSWVWKLALTAITLGTGFKGGEVTPLFFIGATLGNLLAALLGAPTDLLAGLGFIAVFAGAANTPVACTIMGAELFGAGWLPLYAIASFSAYHMSGGSGIYDAQPLAREKPLRARISKWRSSRRRS